MKKGLLKNEYETPECLIFSLEPMKMVMISNESIDGGDDPDVDWVGRPGDIWDLL